MRLETVGVLNQNSSATDPHEVIVVELVFPSAFLVIVEGLEDRDIEYGYVGLHRNRPGGGRQQLVTDVGESGLVRLVVIAEIPGQLLFHPGRCP